MSETDAAKCPFGFGADGSVAPGTYTHAVVTPALSREKLPKFAGEAIPPGDGGRQTGRCLCGRVSYAFDKPVERILANHDRDSRRWSGGIALTIMARAANMTFHGWGSLVQFSLSERQANCFCRTCGSSVFVRHLAPETMDGMLSVSAGTLDSLDGLTLAGETHIDDKPAAYAFEGERRKMTAAEVEAMYQPRPKVAAE